jgi:hypothetical protein
MERSLGVPVKTGLVVKVKEITNDVNGQLSTALNQSRRNVRKRADRRL